MDINPSYCLGLRCSHLLYNVKMSVYAREGELISMAIKSSLRHGVFKQVKESYRVMFSVLNNEQTFMEE